MNEEKRTRFYLDPDVQFPLVALLIVLVTLEGCFVGWGFYKAVIIAQQWQRAHFIGDFVLVVLATIVPMVILNFVLGTYFSHKIAGPLSQMRRAMSEISRGNLESDISLRKGDLLQEFALDFNRMLETLRRLIYRDHQNARDADKILSECRGKLEAQGKITEEARSELEKLVNNAKSSIGIINAHFMKGQKNGE